MTRSRLADAAAPRGPDGGKVRGRIVVASTERNQRECDLRRLLPPLDRRPRRLLGRAGRLIDWQTPFDAGLRLSRPPFASWFVGGTTNLCHNAVDRHLAPRGDQNALIWVSTELDARAVYSFRELHAEVQRMAAILQSLGVSRATACCSTCR
jgi:hypothetical protein